MPVGDPRISQHPRRIKLQNLSSTLKLGNAINIHRALVCRELPLAATPGIHFPRPQITVFFVPPDTLFPLIGDGFEHALRWSCDMNFSDKCVLVRRSDSLWHRFSVLVSRWGLPRQCKQALS